MHVLLYFTIYEKSNKISGLKTLNQRTNNWLIENGLLPTHSIGGDPVNYSDKKKVIGGPTSALHLHDKTTHSSRRSTDVNWRQRVAWRTVIVARISIFFKFLLIEKFEYFRQEDEEWVTPRQMNPNPAFEKETKYFHQFIDTWAPGEAPVQTSHYHPTRLSAVFIQKLGGRTGHVSMKGQLIIV